MNAPKEVILSIIAHRLHGCGIRDTARLCHVHPDTVMRWSRIVGEGCRRLLNRYLRNLRVHQIELDEVWTFVHTKQRHLRPGAPPEHGDVYLFVAEDAVSKAIISAALGKRDADTTIGFAADLRARIVGRPHITSDAFGPYVVALRRAFTSELDYAQLVKVYETARLPDGTAVVDVCTSADWRPRFGTPRLRLASTSHIERMFGTLRERGSKFARMSRHHAKSRRHLETDVLLFIADYNFVRVHSTEGRTPFETLGLADRAWSILELVEAALAEPQPPPLTRPEWAPPSQPPPPSPITIGNPDHASSRT